MVITRTGAEKMVVTQTGAEVGAVVDGDILVSVLLECPYSTASMDTFLGFNYDISYNVILCICFESLFIHMNLGSDYGRGRGGGGRGYGRGRGRMGPRPRGGGNQA